MVFFLAWALTQKTGARGNNGTGSVSKGPGPGMYISQ